jgi:hypothetical protein
LTFFPELEDLPGDRSLSRVVNTIYSPIIDNLRKEDTMMLGMVKEKRGDWAKGLNART